MNTQITAVPQAAYPAGLAGYPTPVSLPDEATQADHGGVDIWGIVARRKWLLVLGLLVGLLAGYLMLTRAIPIYESAAQVLISERRPNLFGPNGYEMQPANMVSNEEKHALTIKSPLIVARAVEEFGLTKLASLGTSKDDAIKEVMNGLTVIPIEGTDIYSIRFRGKNPQDTQKVVEAMYSTYRAFLEEGHKNVGEEFRGELELAKKELDEKLEALNNDYIAFQKTTNLLFQDGKAHNIYESRVLEHEQERNRLVAEHRTTTGELETLKALLKEGQEPESIAQTIRSNYANNPDGNSSPEERALIPLLADLASLKKRYGADHPKVKELQSKIDATTKFLHEFLDIDPFGEGKGKKKAGPEGEADTGAGRFVKLYIESLENKLRQNSATMQLLNKDIEEDRKLADQLKGQTGQEQKLRDEIEHRKMLFRVLVDQLTKTEVGTERESVSIQPIAEATPGSQKEPRASKYLGLGAMLGLLCGFGLGYLVEITDKTFRSPQEIAQALHTVVVGHIPHMEKKRMQVLPGSKLGAVLCTVHRPKSSYAESYRNVRTSVYFSIRGQNKRIIQVTSPTPGDGKSTLAANLAVTMAQSGKRVLLLDADFRRPTQHSVFGIDNTIGLANVVAGTQEPNDVRHEISEVPNLFVMPAGEGVDNPSELLTSQAFEDLLSLFRDQYDFVLIDSPPLLVVSDPGAVAARVDSVLLTFRIDKHAKPVAKRARELLAELGAPVIGVVVNGISQDSVHYSQYGYGYGRYGQYGSYGNHSDKNDSRKYLEDVPISK